LGLAFLYEGEEMNKWQYILLGVVGLLIGFSLGGGWWIIG